MSSFRVPGAAVLAALATMGIAAGGAQASSENVVPVIKQQARAIKSAAASENLKHIKIKTPAQARRDEPKFATLATKLDAAATAVSKASTNSASQRTGKRDWVTGVRGIARGFRQFDKVLGDIARGDKSAAKSEALTAETTLLDASKRLVKADKLLKIHSS